MERPYIIQDLRQLVITRAEHLCEYCAIQPLTDIGEVTARILGFNDNERLLERQLLGDRNKYPHPTALKRMGERSSRND